MKTISPDPYLDAYWDADHRARTWRTLFYVAVVLLVLCCWQNWKLEASRDRAFNALQDKLEAQVNYTDPPSISFGPGRAIEEFPDPAATNLVGLVHPAGK